MRIGLISATAGLSLVAAGVAFAALPKKQALAIMHQRHEGMEKIGDTNKLLRRELTSGAPFVPAGWFPAGTGPDVGNTGAKAEIWANPKDFAAKLRSFQAAAQAFNAAAASGDMDAAKARYADLGRTCKACHDTYRSEMKH